MSPTLFGIVILLCVSGTFANEIIEFQSRVENDIQIGAPIEQTSADTPENNNHTIVFEWESTDHQFTYIHIEVSGVCLNHREFYKYIHKKICNI